MPSRIFSIVIFFLLIKVDPSSFPIVFRYDVTWCILTFSWLRSNHMKARRMWVHGIFRLSHIHLFSWVLAHYTEALPILRCVAGSATAGYWTFGRGLSASSGVAAYWSFLLWLLVAAKAVSKSVRGVCGARGLTLPSAWEAASVASLLWWWVRRGWSLVARFLASLLVLLFYDGLLRLVI